MAKVGVELSAKAVQNLTTPGRHVVGGVSGLRLQVTKAGARSWVLRVMVGNKRRDIGLGGYPTVTLAQARQKARDVREKIEQGIDPILEKQAAKARIIAAQGSYMTFDEATRQFLKVKRAEIDAKQFGNWEATLSTYASPVLGGMHVADIEMAHVKQALEPIWLEKTETAKRLRGRIEKVFAWAIAHKYRKGDNPALWKGNLDAVLQKPSKVAKKRHLAALPYDAMPEFMRDLAKVDGMGADALHFAILTAARSGEVRGATWQEIDFDKGTWTIPGERMKAGKIHHVPLSDATVGLLKSLGPGKPDELLFTASNGQPLSDMSISAVTRRMKVDAVPHGFRSTFRDWAAEQTDYPREVCEMALAHVVRGVEGAYRRGDLYDKRVALMQDWADFINGKRRAG